MPKVVRVVSFFVAHLAIYATLVLPGAGFEGSGHAEVSQGGRRTMQGYRGYLDNVRKGAEWTRGQMEQISSGVKQVADDVGNEIGYKNQRQQQPSYPSADMGSYGGYQRQQQPSYPSADMGIYAGYQQHLQGIKKKVMSAIHDAFQESDKCPWCPWPDQFLQYQQHLQGIKNKLISAIHDAIPYVDCPWNRPECRPGRITG